METEELPNETTCKVCDQPLVVLDITDRDKPLRCSDSCPENRKSLNGR